MQTLELVNPYVPYSDYVLNLSNSTTSPTILFLSFLRYSGHLGNAIFFLCSAWFLLDKNVSSKKKALRIIADVWVMSISILIPVLIIRKGDIGFKLLIKSIFPTIFANNWYLTCYILFVFIYPFLNRLIDSMTRRELLGAALFLGLIYIGINFFVSSFFVSELIIWISLYFILAYIKKYLLGLSHSAKFAVILIVVGVVCNTLIVIFTNIIGLKIEWFSDKLLRWNALQNPFLQMIALGAFILFRKIKFHNKFINGVSSLSLLIYILHENLLLKTYYRTLLWHEIYLHFGYDYIFAWVFAITIVIFFASVIISWIYSKTIQKLTHKVSDKLYVLLKKLYGIVEEKIFKVPKG